MPQILSVSCPLVVQMMTGICCVAGSCVMARVAWKPFRPGITTSIRIRSGNSVLEFATACSPLSAYTSENPFLLMISPTTCRSVPESSITITLFMAIIRFLCVLGCMHSDCFDQTFFAEWLGQVLVGADQLAARTVEQAVLAGQHDHRRVLEFGMALDQCAGVVAVPARHHDVDKNDGGLVIDHFGQAVETVFRQH